MRRLSAFSLVILISTGSWSAAAERYDTVLAGGRIVDGQGNPWFYGDVAVNQGRIAAIGALGEYTAGTVIDCAGLVVAPGFIDIHSHSDYLLLEDGDAQSKIRQGVTTEVLGEGSSAGPYKGKLAPRRMEVAGSERAWSTLGEYFALLEEVGTAVNVASYVGLGNVWRCALGESFDRPTPEQTQEMETVLREALEDGAFGLSSMLAAPPELYATTDDIVGLCRVVRDFGGIFSTHMRNEGTLVLESVEESIHIGRAAGVRVDIIHLKIAEERLWGYMDRIVERIDTARAQGVDVQANVYPYTRGNNNLVSIVPPWAHEGGDAALIGRLEDSALRSRMKHDIERGVEGWYNHYLAVGGDWSRMLVNADLSETNKRFEGWTMDRIIEARSSDKDPRPDPFDVLFDFLIEENGSISTIYAHHTDEDRNLALVQPWCSVGSDGLSYAIEGPLRRGKPHPRSFGTFPRILGRFVREEKLLTLEDAIRKMTSLNANKLGLRDRGTIRLGAVADLTAFDPERVADRATYLDPFQYPVGIEYVIVNGTLVVAKGNHTGARPGHVLRRGR